MYYLFLKAYKFSFQVNMRIPMRNCPEIRVFHQNITDYKWRILEIHSCHKIFTRILIKNGKMKSKMMKPIPNPNKNSKSRINSSKTKLIKRRNEEKPKKKNPKNSVFLHLSCHDRKKTYRFLHRRKRKRSKKIACNIVT